MKVLVTGARGQLGVDVVNELYKRGHEVVGVDKEEMDITNPLEVNKVMSNFCPDAVIHCAAWTAVDAAEEEKNIPIVKAINFDGTRIIAEMCKQLNCKMLYVSTDYVFDGQGAEPWKPDCKNFSPLNFYGKTKLEGELVVADLLQKYYIVRIAWVFGIHGNNFVKTMLTVGKEKDTVRVVSDQIGTPTYTVDLSRLLVDMIQTEEYGYYHATNEGGFISWYDFTKEIYHQAGIKTKVIPIKTSEYYTAKAKRPLNSRLDKSKLIDKNFTLLPDWKDALKRYMKEFYK